MAPRGNPVVSTETHAEREGGGGEISQCAAGPGGLGDTSTSICQSADTEKNTEGGEEEKTQRREQKRRVQGTHSTTISWQKSDKKWPSVEISAVT